MRIAHVSSWLTCLILLPAAALAQASITGIVRDASGTLLNGVLVEASSPALIEKQRLGRTDGTGQYRILDLRPGTYSVKFTLDGFTVVSREGVELTGALTATVNAQLEPGATGQGAAVLPSTSTVDVQSATRQVTVTSELINAIPTAKSYGGLMTLVPSIIATTADSQVTPRMLGFSGPGGRGGSEGRLEIDGMNMGFVNGNGVSTYVADVQNAREVTFTTSPGLGESEVSAPVLSVVPQTGGNQFHGSLYTAMVSSRMVGSNYSAELQDAGLTSPNSLTRLWDVNTSVGGPIARDRLWFFTSVRDQGSYRTIAGLYANLHAGDPSKWTYAADTTRPAEARGSWTIVNARLTAQLSRRHKINLFWDEQMACAGAAWAPGIDACRAQPDAGAIVAGGSQSQGLAPAATSTTAPETATYLDGSTPQRVQQVTWQSPLTDRLLVEAGFGTYLVRTGGEEMPGNPTGDFIRVTEQCSNGCPANGDIAGLAYRSATWANNWNGRYNWRASASLASGAWSLKAGYQGGYFVADNVSYTNTRNLAYRVNNGVPNQLTQSLNPFTAATRTRFDAAYAQAQRTVAGLTLQGALRFDRAWSWYPAAQIGPTQFLPSPIASPETKGVDAFTDVSPRIAVAYDLFGNARTSIKFNVGRYLEPASTGPTYGGARPTARLTTTANRAWTDGNQNFVADCDLLSPERQDRRGSGGDLCAEISDRAFGTPMVRDTYDPALLTGWGVRPADWSLGASVEHELTTGVSIEAGYYRRWLTGFTITDNRAQAPSDFGTFSIVAPLDPRLPGGGGYTIGGLYDPNQNVASTVDNYITSADGYGRRYQHYNGLLVNLNLRLANGAIVKGGVNTGRTVGDTCENRAFVPETALVNPYCHVDSGMVTRVTAMGTYTVPRLDVQVAGTFRSDPGLALVANYVVSNAEIVPSLGRNLSNGVANITVNLIAPGSLYGDRVNEVSLRVARTFRAGQSRITAGVDLNNVFNSAPVLDYNLRFIPGTQGPWTTPIAVLQPRYGKLSVQFDF